MALNTVSPGNLAASTGVGAASERQQRARGDDSDVFMRRMPVEYWQTSLPSTLSLNLENVGRGNTSLVPLLRDELRVESNDRTTIVPRNHADQLRELVTWIHDLAKAGDSNAKDIEDRVTLLVDLLHLIDVGRSQVLLS